VRAQSKELSENPDTLELVDETRKAYWSGWTLIFIDHLFVDICAMPKIQPKYALAIDSWWLK
jgi:hypothetical protein